MALLSHSFGSSTGLAYYSLQLHNPGAGGCCARHLIAFEPGWKGLVTHPHVSLSRAYIGKMFIEIMRAFNLFASIIFHVAGRQSCLHVPFVIHAYILPTSFLLDLDVGHPFPNLLQYSTHSASLHPSLTAFLHPHLQSHSYFHNEHPIVLTLYIYIIIYLYSRYPSLLNSKKV